MAKPTESDPSNAESRSSDAPTVETEGAASNPPEQQKRRPSRAEARKLRVSRMADLKTVDVRIDRLVEGGLGMGFFEKIPILVPRSAPGDLLRVELTDKQPDYARGEITKVLEAGASRVPARCSVYAECGGCDLQHIESSEQTPIKVRAALETLRRIGGLEPPEPSIRQGDDLGYRGRAQLQVRGQGEELDIGFFGRGSHDLVPTLRCPVLEPELEAWLPQVLAALRTETSPPKRLDLLAGDEGTLSVAPVVAGLPHGPVVRRIGDFEYEVDARCFFQAHSKLAPDLVQLGVGDLEGDAVVELHAGVGLFTLPLSRRYGRIFVAESDRVAVRYLRKNAKKHGVDNLEVSATSAEHAVEVWSTGPEQEAFRKAERWLLDPPRSGLSRKLVAQLSRFRPETVTYVSCQVPTLARDLSKLDWIYEVERITFLDLFPQTAHLEAVVQLRRRKVLKQRKLEGPEPSRVSRSRKPRPGGPGPGRGEDRSNSARRFGARGNGPPGGGPRGDGRRGGPRGSRRDEDSRGRRGQGRGDGPRGRGGARDDRRPDRRRSDGESSGFRRRGNEGGPDRRSKVERRPKLGGGWGGGSGGDPQDAGGRTPRKRRQDGPAAPSRRSPGGASGHGSRKSRADRKNDTDEE